MENKKTLEKKTEKEPKYSEVKNNQPKVEIVEETILPETKSMIAVKHFSMPLANVADIKVASEKYQEFLNALLNQKDIVKIKDKKSGEEKLMAKKSGFGKIARFWGVSTEVIKSFFEEHECKNDVCVWSYFNGRSVPKIKRGDRYLIAKAWIKAILPSGQFAVRGAACSEAERNFAHIPHDLLATAETRAAKRAIEAVIGMGEIEMEEDNGEAKPEQVKAEPIKDDPILPEQISDISKLLEETSAPLDKFLAFLSKKYNVGGLNELTKKQAITILRALRDKKSAATYNEKN